MRSPFVVLLLMAALAHASARQRPAAPQPPAFKRGTNLVRVDIYATKDGRPVQDLTAADFQVREDGVPQTIDSFEHILVQPAVASAERDPNTTGEMNEMIADPHRRVFVLYLDTNFTTIGGSHDISKPLIDLLTRLLGKDDMVGVMTPEMSPEQIVFARKTDVITSAFWNQWAWGRRDTLKEDAQEQMLDECYPASANDRGMQSGRAVDLIQRHRERMTLDSLEALVTNMAGRREGRTAVLAVTTGWLLYTPDESLKTLQGVEAMPRPPITRLGPTGGMTTGTDNSLEGQKYECDKLRAQLAEIDDERYFQDILQDANRADVSFYPIDPRGMPVFDSDIGPNAPPPPSVDAAMLAGRQDVLRSMAVDTDGIALLNSNDLTAQLHRVADDLTSYYLISYYSTNTKADGKFRTISVKSTRPGVAIRARRGYRAPTKEEMAEAAAAPPAPVADTRAALNTALGALTDAARGQRAPVLPDGWRVLHRGPSTGNQLQRAATAVFPRSERLRFEKDASAGDTLTAVLLDRNGDTLPVPVAVGAATSGSADAEPRVLTADLTLAPLGAGDYVVQLTVTHGAEQRTALIALRVTMQ